MQNLIPEVDRYVNGLIMSKQTGSSYACSGQTNPYAPIPQTNGKGKGRKRKKKKMLLDI